jgi:hypothetical protein
MSSQATVHSIDALKDLRTALALYGDDTLGALGAVEAEVRRTTRWLQDERPYFWQEQIKRRREQVALAKSELFRRQIQKKADYAPPMSEQKENLRKAEATLQDAEKRLTAVRKWQPMFTQAVLEYHASIQRLKDMASGDVPRAVNLLTRIIDALEAYLRVAPPSGSGQGAELATSPALPPMASIATAILDEDAASTPSQAAADDDTVDEASGASRSAEIPTTNDDGPRPDGTPD